MEAVGSAASIVSLVHILGITARATRDVYQRFKEAPSQLQSLERDILLLRAGFAQIQHLYNNGPAQALGKDVREVIDTTINSAQGAMIFLEGICEKQHQRTGGYSRSRWALSDASKMEQKVNELDEHRQKLQNLLDILGLEQQTRILLGIGSIKNELTELAKNFNDSPHLGLGMSKAEKQVTVGTTTRSPFAVVNTKSTAAWLRELGLACSLVARTSEHLGGVTEYSLAFRFQARPIQSAISVQLRWRYYKSSGFISINQPSNIHFCRIVPQDSPAMLACRRGDLSTLQQELRSGGATLRDVTPDNWTLMAGAIYGGNVAIVQFLLQNGVGVDTHFGDFQTSPIQWSILRKQVDVTRCLLSYGADVNQVSSEGWSAVFCFWPQAITGQTVKKGHFELLKNAEHDVLELDLVDKWGWTVLQRVAAYGTSTDVRELVHLGADIHGNPPLELPAIFYSAIFNNLKTFVELLQYYSPDIVHAQDERGWTLLHISASVGNSEITRHLLNLGSDPWALSLPVYDDVPAIVQGRRCTPADVAAAESPERLILYERMLIELGLTTERDLQEDVHLENQFLDALEDVPLL